MFRMLEWRREKKNHSTPHSLMQMGIGIKIHFQRNKTHACQNFDSALDHDRHFWSTSIPISIPIHQTHLKGCLVCGNRNENNM